MKLHPDAPVKHLLVDLDGTLLGNQSAALSIDFVRRSLGVLKKYGGLKTASSVLLGIYHEFGRPSKDTTNDIRVVKLVANRLNLTLEEARLELRRALTLIFPSLKKHFYPIPGSRDFLEWAKERYPLTLATNPVWPPDIVEMRVRWAGIDPAIFGFITHAKTMHAVKPHPEYYREILEKQGLSAEDCLLVGDNVKKDLPATHVGIRVFIVSPASSGKSSGGTGGPVPLKTPKPSAPAWKGTYTDLRGLLETRLSPQLPS